MVILETRRGHTSTFLILIIKGRSPFNYMIFIRVLIAKTFVHRKFKKIDQLIFRNAKEIYFNEKIPIL